MHSRTPGTEPASDRVGEELCFLQLVGHSEERDGAVAGKLRFRVKSECSIGKQFRSGTVNSSVLDVINAIVDRFKRRSYLPWAQDGQAFVR